MSEQKRPAWTEQYMPITIRERIGKTGKVKKLPKAWRTVTIFNGWSPGEALRKNPATPEQLDRIRNGFYDKQRDEWVGGFDWEAWDIEV